MNLVSLRGLRTKSMASAMFIAALALTAPMSFAHTELVSATPAANSTVTAPQNVTIKFSGALEAKFSKITVVDASGKPVNKEASAVGADTKSMTVALPVLSPGLYTVQWVAVSTDSHRSQGSYKFTVK